MNDHPKDLDRLRDAFRDLADRDVAQSDDFDAEEIWAAARGELGSARTRELLEKSATSPAIAEAWRLAAEVQRDIGGISRAADRPRRRGGWVAAGMAAAAVIVLGISLPLWERGPGEEPAGFRDQTPVGIVAVTPDGAALPRDEFTLTWSGPAAAEYALRITTEDLAPVLSEARLEDASFTVPSTALTGVPDGTRLLWRVEATLGDGRKIASPTFVVRVE